MESGGKELFLRRLVAHLTTPLVIGILLGLVWFPESGGAAGLLAHLGAYIGFAYLGWLMLGVPGLLLRRSEGPKTAARYAGLGALCAAALLAPLLIFLGFDPESGLELLWTVGPNLPVGALAGLWYWFCVHWRPASAGQSGSASAGGATIR